MEYRFVKPKEGLLIRDPKSKKFLPKEGTRVPWIGVDGRYYRRRYRDGVIEIIEEPKKMSIDDKEEFSKRKYRGGE